MIDIRFLPQYGRSKGLSLPTALALLLVLVIIGTGFVSQTLYNEQIAGNQHEYVIASHEANAGLREGESFLRNCTGRPQSSGTIKIDSTPSQCTEMDFLWDDRLADYQKDTSTSTLPWFQQPWTWWTNPRTRAANSLNSSHQARYVIEEVKFVYDSPNDKSGYSTAPGTGFYRVTARGRAQSENSAVTLQSGFSRHFN